MSNVIYLKHNGRYYKIPYKNNGDLPVVDDGAIEYLKSTDVQNILAYLDRGVYKYIDLADLFGVMWGSYLPSKQVDIIWGTYDNNGGLSVRHDITASDCTNINQYFMIENDWHKMEGIYDPHLQSPLYDALDEKMDNPEYVIDIYYKCICCRPDAWNSAAAVLNPNGYTDLYPFSTYGFIPTFKDESLTPDVYYGGYIDNPSSPFTLPPYSDLCDGNTSVVFPEGFIFDSFPSVGYWSTMIWNELLGRGDMPSNRAGVFLNLAGEATGVAMLASCDQYTPGTVTYVINPAYNALGLPYIHDEVWGGHAAMPQLFKGFIMTPQRQYKYGFIYVVLGVHKINGGN